MVHVEEMKRFGVERSEMSGRIGSQGYIENTSDVRNQRHARNQRHNENREHIKSYYVTAKDIRPFDNQRLELADMVAERKNRYAREHRYRAMVAYDFLEGECRIGVDTMKKAINGTLKINRTFLYKFAVGLRMSVEEANAYFALCGGPLNESVREDFICLRALEDGDSIELFVKQFEEFTGSKIDIRERRSAVE